MQSSCIFVIEVQKWYTHKNKLVIHSTGVLCVSHLKLATCVFSSFHSSFRIHCVIVVTNELNEFSNVSTWSKLNSKSHKTLFRGNAKKRGWWWPMLLMRHSYIGESSVQRWRWQQMKSVKTTPYPIPFHSLNRKALSFQLVHSRPDFHWTHTMMCTMEVCFFNIVYLLCLSFICAINVTCSRYFYLMCYVPTIRTAQNILHWRLTA